MNRRENDFFDVLIIGGGAAGMMAAVAAAMHGAKTVIIEHRDRVGKKILSTGNGKCNYTNELQDIAYYRGDDPSFVLPVMEQFGFRETVSFFEQLGISPKNRNGYFYPASGQASSVLDAFRMEMKYRRISVETDCEIINILNEQQGFCLTTNRGIYMARKIIFAPGLLAAPKTGSDGSAMPFIKAFGHHFSDIVPALVALECEESFFKQLAGIRTEAKISLWINDKKVSEETGELQLTNYGISGIPVFQISRFATKALKKKEKVTAKIDFLPVSGEEEIRELFHRRFHLFSHEKTACEAMNGLLNRKLNEVLLKEAHIPFEKKAEKVSDQELVQLGKLCKNFCVSVTGNRSFDQAQVCAGGVLTKEINPKTMESRLTPNVYFAGEVVDIDGACGGYNLQWAWSSGFVAGTHAAENT